jgi:peptidoglycan/xylan/chitin deacetylase (PgdA/CDA1 family)
MFYWIKTQGWIRWLLPGFVWKIPSREKTVYLTFDDGPTPGVTPFVLETLKRYRAQATFFCIGDNIRKHADIFNQVVDAGHSVGNHTFNHINGWKTGLAEYLHNTSLCRSAIGLKTNLFRPPYGKVTPSQRRSLVKLGYRIVMWDVLSADFDASVSPEKCLSNVLENVEPGSIVIFHDSEKARRNLEYALPRTLEFLNEKGFACGSLPQM